MSTTTLYPGALPAAKRAPAASPASKAAVGAPTGAQAPVAAYPWLTATIRRNMSARARRLMRADY